MTLFLSSGLCALVAPGRAAARPYRLTESDRAEITAVLRAFFDAARDGDRAAVVLALPTRADLDAIFEPGFAPFIVRHVEAVDRAVRGLQTRFAGGTFVGLAAPFNRDASVDLRSCGRFTRASTECVLGPIIEWRVGTETRRMRVDSLVRINGHWRIFDPTL